MEWRGWLLLVVLLAASLVQARYDLSLLTDEERIGVTDCVGCVHMLSGLQDMLDAYKLAKFVDTKLAPMCNMLPAAMVPVCNRQVRYYGPAQLRCLVLSMRVPTVCATIPNPTLVLGTHTAACKGPRNVEGCYTCRFIMSVLKRWFQTPDAKSGVVRQMYQFCTHADDSVKAQCNRLLNQYANILYDIETDRFDPNIYCADTGACAGVATLQLEGEDGLSASPSIGELSSSPDARSFLNQGFPIIQQLQNSSSSSSSSSPPFASSAKTTVSAASPATALTNDHTPTFQQAAQAEAALALMAGLAKRKERRSQERGLAGGAGDTSPTALHEQYRQWKLQQDLQLQHRQAQLQREQAELLGVAPPLHTAAPSPHQLQKSARPAHPPAAQQASQKVLAHADLGNTGPPVLTVNEQELYWYDENRCPAGYCACLVRSPQQV